MPVVVTGADTPLGRAAVEAFSAAGVGVRATVRDRGAAAELAGLGVLAAVSDCSDPQRLGGVLEDAHTVVHLDPAPLEHLLDAAEGTAVRRVVLVGAPGAAPPPCPPYDVVLVRAGPRAPLPAVAAALVAADTRRDVAPVGVLDAPQG